MRILRIAASLLLVALLAAPGAAAQTDERLPCIRPIDVHCILHEVGEEANAAADYGNDLLQWVECQLTSLIWCGPMPLPPYVPSAVDAPQPGAAASADSEACNIHAGCDVGPCGYAQFGPGVVVQPGNLSCYTAYAIDTLQRLIADGADWLGWLSDLLDWVECVQNGGGIECDSPPRPPNGSAVDIQ